MYGYGGNNGGGGGGGGNPFGDQPPPGYGQQGPDLGSAIHTVMQMQNASNSFGGARQGGGNLPPPMAGGAGMPMPMPMPVLQHQGMMGMGGGMGMGMGGMGMGGGMGQPGMMDGMPGMNVGIPGMGTLPQQNMPGGMQNNMMQGSMMQGSMMGHPSQSIMGSGVNTMGLNFPFEQPNINQTDAQRVVEEIYRACKGLGTDEKRLIQAVCSQSNANLRIINRMYKMTHHKNLKKLIRGETSGWFRSALVAIVTYRPHYDAKTLNGAIKGLGTDEKLLIDILTTRTNAEIRYIAEYYQKKFKHTLKKDVEQDTSGDFRRILTVLCMGQRDESGMVNPQMVQADADALYRAGKARLGTDESVFTQIMAQRSQNHLNAVSQAYQNTYRRSLEGDIKGETSSWYRLTLLALILPRYQMTVKWIMESMKGVGTDDKTLVRLVCSKSRNQLQQIERMFLQFYGKSLHDWVKSDTSGDYRRTLQCWIAGSMH